MVNIPRKSRKGVPPPRDAAPANLDKIDPKALTPMNFKVPEAFHREFKTYAAANGMAMVEVLVTAFEELKKHGSSRKNEITKERTKRLTKEEKDALAKVRTGFVARRKNGELLIIDGVLRAPARAARTGGGSQTTAKARTGERPMKRVKQPEPTAVKRAVGYVPVSTEKQADKGVSLEAQSEKIRAMVSVHDAELVDVIVEGGESAKSLDRPGIGSLAKASGRTGHRRSDHCQARSPDAFGS